GGLSSSAGQQRGKWPIFGRLGRLRGLCRDHRASTSGGFSAASQCERKPPAETRQMKPREARDDPSLTDARCPPAITTLRMEMIMRTFSPTTLPRNFAGDSIIESVAKALKRWWLAYMDWRLQRLTIELLRGMSDRELKDIDLCRSQIEFEVRARAPRHPMLDGRHC